MTDARLTLRTAYFGTKADRAALANLLDDIFSIDIRVLDKLGGPDPSSMPFGYFDESGRCVANLSAFSMPVVIDGRFVRAAGFQSGAVRPEWRGRGLYRDLMRRAFDWSDKQGFEFGLLLTDKPTLYAPYGFRSVPQHRFAGRPPAASGRRIASKPLTLPADGGIVKDILSRRSPVSLRFAVARQAEMFLLNGCFDPDLQLTHLPSEDAVVAWKLETGRLCLLDVVASSIPTLADIIAGLDIRVEEVEICFPPDLLGWDGAPEAFAGHTQLMARGNAMADLSHPIMLSPLAEF